MLLKKFDLLKTISLSVYSNCYLFALPLNLLLL